MKRTRILFSTTFCLAIISTTTWAAAPAKAWVDDDYPAASVNDGHTWRVHAFATLQEGIDALATNDNRDWLNI